MWLVLVRTPQLAFWNCSFLDSSIRRLDLVIYLPMFLMFSIHPPPALASSASAASLAVSAWAVGLSSIVHCPPLHEENTWKFVCKLEAARVTNKFGMFV